MNEVDKHSNSKTDGKVHIFEKPNCRSGKVRPRQHMHTTIIGQTWMTQSNNSFSSHQDGKKSRIPFLKTSEILKNLHQIFW
jgi:hypothetical protein